MHLHSTPNNFQRIMYGISLDSYVNPLKVEISIDPYNIEQDQFSMISSKHNKNLAAIFHKDTGILEITHTGVDPVSKEDWELAFSYPSYRLFIRRRRPNSCALFTHGKYERAISMQVTDQYGRKSNVISRNLFIKTSLVMFTSEKPVKITNEVDRTSYRMYT